MTMHQTNRTNTSVLSMTFSASFKSWIAQTEFTRISRRLSGWDVGDGIVHRWVDGQSMVKKEN